MITRDHRTRSVVVSLVLTLAATVLFVDYVASVGTSGIDVVRVVLLMTTTYGLAWGATVMLEGLFGADAAPVPPPRPRLKRPLCAVVIPIFNEDPVATFARVGAMNASLSRIGALDGFHFVILSDTRDDHVAFLEEYWLSRLTAERCGGHIFYRRRSDNIGKKAGNIADFIRTSGAQYDFLLFLDADSLMEGETMVELVRRLDAAPDVALIQTLPRTIGARTLFGRGLQFSSWFFSPIFARGLAKVQGEFGVFWGHNAIVRTKAFAASCGLPELSGKPPFGGHVLSHDYVEAALLARAGWKLRLDADLNGSFEEAPENLIDYAKRDRRWCQGNLQHVRLLLASGLKLWSRHFLVHGIMAYVASPLWLAFLVFSVVAALRMPEPDYFPSPHMLFPQFPHAETAKAVMVLAAIFGLLVVPRSLVAARRIVARDTDGFNGPAMALCSFVMEFMWTAVLAPLMLMYQSRSVLQVLLGADGGWPPTRRSGVRVGWGEAWAASWWIVLTGCGALTLSAVFWRDLGLWLVPVTVPMACAPLIIVISSARRSGQLTSKLGLLATPPELHPQPIILERQAILSRWRRIPSIPSGAGEGVGAPTTRAIARATGR